MNISFTVDKQVLKKCEIVIFNFFKTWDLKNQRRMAMIECFMVNTIRD